MLARPKYKYLFALELERTETGINISQEQFEEPWKSIEREIEKTSNKAK